LNKPHRQFPRTQDHRLAADSETQGNISNTYGKNSGADNQTFPEGGFFLHHKADKAPAPMT